MLVNAFDPRYEFQIPQHMSCWVCGPSSRHVFPFDERKPYDADDEVCSDCYRNLVITYAKRIENLIDEPSSIGKEDIISSPLLKWAHLLNQQFYVARFGDPLSKRDLDGSIRLEKLSNSLEGLWKESINHGLRARRVVMSQITLSGLAMPGFHNLELTSQSWAKCLDIFQKTFSYLWFLGYSTQWMKFHTASLFCRMKKQKEFPKIPSGVTSLYNKPGYFLTGIGYCFLRYLNLQKDSANRDRVASSWLHLKKGLPPVPPMDLKNGINDWYVNLTVDKPLAEIDYVDFATNEIYRTMMPKSWEEWLVLSKSKKRFVLSLQCQRTVVDLFRNKDPIVDYMRIPSQSSHIEKKKFSGGAFAYLGEYLHGVSNEYKIIVDKKDKTKATFTHEKVKEGPGFIPKGYQCELEDIASDLITSCDNCGWGDSPDHGWLSHYINGLNPCGLAEEITNEPDFSLNDFFSDILQHWQSKGPRFQNLVSPVALPEPLKVRLISRGPALRYWLGSGIQKWMHTTLKRHPTFVAIGRPLCAEDLDKTLFCCADDEVYLSGDYKAATDLIDPYLSRACCSMISRLGKFGTFMSAILEEGLVGATLDMSNYRDGILMKWENGFPIHDQPFDFPKQTWGQLMGSPLSFPILCVINAAVNRYFYELMSVSKYRDQNSRSSKLAFDQGKDFYIPKTDLKDTYELEEVPMLINGDDVLTKINPLNYDKWKSFVAEAGLIPSVGKNYISKDFVIINSTLFRQEEGQLGSNFQEEPYFNSGLFHPTLDGKLDTDHFSLDTNVFDLGTISHKLTKNQSFEIADRMMSIFMGDPTVKGLLKNVPEGVSYYVSKTLGGCGIYASRDGLLTSEQKGYYTRIATACGELAPLVEESPAHLGDYLDNLYKEVKGVELSEDWNLQLKYAGPSLGSLWDEYLRKDHTSIPLINNIRGFVKDLGITSLNGRADHELIGRGYMANLVRPSSTGLLRSRRSTLSQQLLCNFPWSRQVLKAYDPPKITANLEVFRELNELSIDEVSECRLLNRRWYDGYYLNNPIQHLVVNDYDSTDLLD